MNDENRIEIIDEITYVEVVEDNTTLEVAEDTVSIIEITEQGPPGIGTPTGGTAGQILHKISDENYDYGWTTNPVDVIQERYDSNNDGKVDNAEHSDISDDSNLVGGRPITDFYDRDEVNYITARYTYSQPTASTDWIITHNLGRFPSGVTVVDSAGSIIEGAVQFINNNSLKISFNYAFSGTAYIG